MPRYAFTDEEVPHLKRLYKSPEVQALLDQAAQAAEDGEKKEGFLRAAATHLREQLDIACPMIRCEVQETKAEFRKRQKLNGPGLRRRQAETVEEFGTRVKNRTEVRTCRLRNGV